MRTLLKILIIVCATFSFSETQAACVADSIPVPLKPNPKKEGTLGPKKTPPRWQCPVSVIYDDAENMFSLFGAEDHAVTYAIFDDADIMLQSGTIVLSNGEGAIRLSGPALPDGSTIELIIDEHTFIGVIEW